ncbi:hypothetical protein Rhopal_006123-T1 [Rhodotorula paludigena]|uniref:Aminoglycoside phosphotransferase domain-containing protein n=1 Tax=Rhodotorula paludigena TaxID=86838 RepID=A0AAV5GS70_9BASI|nr:hypothetical protein Rhopal_006123-T1 [Rhodotorula paludigena]
MLRRLVGAVSSVLSSLSTPATPATAPDVTVALPSQAVEPCTMRLEADADDKAAHQGSTLGKCPCESSDTGYSESRQPRYVAFVDVLTSPDGSHADLPPPANGLAHVKKVEWRGRVMAVKYGTRVSTSEAEVMQMVYGVQLDAGIVYIYQEFIEGESLLHAWSRLSASARQALLDHLLAIVRSLSTITPPDGSRLGRLDPASLRPILEALHVSHMFPDPLPPPRTAPEFSAWLHARLARRDSDRADACDDACMRRLARSDAPVCLVHGDLAARNLVVRAGEAKIAAVLDWESAAWLPAWVETFNCTLLSGYLSTIKGEYADVAIAQALGGGAEGTERWHAMCARFRLL